jgi:hypothetical protein
MFPNYSLNAQGAKVSTKAVVGGYIFETTIEILALLSKQ